MTPARRPDPIALHSPLRARLFFALLERRLAQAFSAVRVQGAFTASLAASLEGRPLVVYCNHPAWWDVPLLVAVVTRLAPGRRLFAPFEAEALGGYRFMERCGAFGVEPGSARGARRFLEVGQRVLADPGSVLCVTPQGAFTDPRARPLVLQRGLAALLERVPRAIALPVALEYPFWTESRPEALARVGEPIAAEAGAPLDADAWQHRLVGGLTAAMDALAADASAREPSRFRTLREGRAGVGGVYDAWRRLRASLAGRRFDARHGGGSEPDRHALGDRRAAGARADGGVRCADGATDPVPRLDRGPRGAVP